MRKPNGSELEVLRLGKRICERYGCFPLPVLKQHENLTSLSRENAMTLITPENSIKDLLFYVSTQQFLLSETALTIFEEAENLAQLYNNPVRHIMVLAALVRHSNAFQNVITDAGRDCAIVEKRFLEKIPDSIDNMDSYEHPRHQFPYSSKHKRPGACQILVDDCLHIATRKEREIIQDTDTIETVLNFHDAIHPIEENRDWTDERLDTPYNTLSHIVGEYYPELDIEFNWIRKRFQEDRHIEPSYIDLSRIDELRRIKHPSFDLAKLIRLCEELNNCHTSQNYFAVGILTRAILDHVPPILGVRTFSEVANNYGGGRSFKESMKHLEMSSRKIADRLLHGTIRAKEPLPNFAQVNFSNDLDVLLQEIVQLLR